MLPTVPMDRFSEMSCPMKSRRLRPLVLFACLLLPLAAFAQRGQKSVIPELDEDSRRGEIARIAQQKAEAKFDAADGNKDDKLAPEEVAGPSPYIAENFKQYDKDSDGFLSWEEYVGHNRWKRQPKK